MRPKTSRAVERSFDPPCWTALVLCGLVLTAGMTTATFAERDRGDRPSRAEQPLNKDLRYEVSKRSATDPIGDATGGPDITALVVEASGESLHVTLTFSGSVSGAGSGQANAVSGFIDIDSDQNGDTGMVPWTDFLAGANTGMGNEYYVDLFTFDGREVAVVDEATQEVVGFGEMEIGTYSVTVWIPLEVIGNDGLVNVAAVTTDADDEPVDHAPSQGSVASESTAVLLSERFLVTIDWRGEGLQRSPAFVSDFRTDDSANFYFLDPANLEFLIKVLDACDSSGHFWVFFAGATDVEFTVTVTDTLNGQQNTYSNPLGSPANAVTDTTAFATCP